MKIGLVGCVKQKLAVAAPARDLYVSPLFLGRRACVEQSCDCWFVLSALHGVVEPADVLAPYDKTLKEAGRAERRRWSAEVLGDLDVRLGGLGGHIYEIHAGHDYFGFGLVDGLEKAGANVQIPTKGLPVGKQLAWYAQWR